MSPDWERKFYTALLITLNGVAGFAFNVRISWTGSVTAGSSTTFTCSSSCFVNCTYSWSLKGHRVNGSTLIWAPDGQDRSMALQCTVLSLKTGVTSSATSIVDITNPVSVQISPPGSVPSLNRPLDLLCHVAGELHPTVSVQQEVRWYKDGHRLASVENILHFDSLLPSDGGFYQCETLLPQSRVLSLGYLLSFDQWNVSINGPDTVFPGRLSTFTCIMTCTLNVDCTVRWPFKGGFPLGSYLSVHHNELSWIPSVPGSFQNFTCLIENKAAGRSAEATKMVEVKGIPLSGSLKLTGLRTVILILALLVMTY
uniref:carcinoembryonic antigen-related cell adhesion molecule 20-like n=1 Tax=Doryrhamphus excisus TaxID=161450 RepID=UPI0025AE77D4|nr:carcinoembryonic antigen-related cell adhesion molecule 20-like [Doryrhamphus excisus]